MGTFIVMVISYDSIAVGILLVKNGTRYVATGVEYVFPSLTCRARRIVSGTLIGAFIAYTPN